MSYNYLVIRRKLNNYLPTSLSNLVLSFFEESLQSAVYSLINYLNVEHRTALDYLDYLNKYINNFKLVGGCSNTFKIVKYRSKIVQTEVNWLKSLSTILAGFKPNGVVKFQQPLWSVGMAEFLQYLISYGNSVNSENVGVVVSLNRKQKKYVTVCHSGKWNPNTLIEFDDDIISLLDTLNKFRNRKVTYEIKYNL